MASMLDPGYTPALTQLTVKPPITVQDEAGSSEPKYPHTRAILLSIASDLKQYDENSPEDERAIDGSQRVSPTIVSQAVKLLDNDDEDGLKDLLRTNFGDPNDESELDHHVLELMHKHRDDVSGVPFLFLTPTKRPISRPSSRASTHSTRLAPNRPDTPNSLPNSPLGTTFRRPHTPLASPLAPNQAANATSYMTGSTTQPAQTSNSSPPSPHLLNAKAVEFRPIARPLSAASSHSGAIAGMRTETPSPDLWAPSSRASSNLAIAAPLVAEASYAPSPRSLTPNNTSARIRSSNEIDEDYEDEFDPFSTKPRTAAPPILPSVATLSDPEAQWSSNSNSSQSTSLESTTLPSTDDDVPLTYGYSTFSMPLGEYEYDQGFYGEDGQYPDEQSMLTDGMTPLDVLGSVFGGSVPPADLHDALEANGYDFDRTMAWLIDRSIPVGQQPPQVATARPYPQSSQMGGRVVVVPRESGMAKGLRGNMMTRGTSKPTGRPTQGANRVCRYFLAGECLRADCRFSHDIERAMCRFWLRGICAKQENCEFLHHLPKDVDVAGLTMAMSRSDLANSGNDGSPSTTPPPDDFPLLGQFDGRAQRGGFHNSRGHRQYFDPGRTRFSNAVKSSPKSMAYASQGTSRLLARRMDTNRLPVAPRASPRIKLRAPTLLPTLPTGDVVNRLYMAYRQRSLQLGAARNACLSRAADAWRRGDGAAAKRFSREGHELNAKMSGEAADAAAKLVRERVKVAADAVRERDVAWSDEPRDKSDRGRIVGTGLGVLLGVASRDVGSESGGTRLTPDERTEALLDLHGLHANEAVEVLEKFLLTLEKEGFFGLAFVVVGEEKHTGTQDAARGTSRVRLSAGVREWLHDWGYPWNEREGVICVDPLTHAS